MGDWILFLINSSLSFVSMHLCHQSQMTSEDNLWFMSGLFIFFDPPLQNMEGHLDSSVFIFYSRFLLLWEEVDPPSQKFFGLCAMEEN